jgi:hypothetical protein
MHQVDPAEKLVGPTAVPLPSSCTTFKAHQRCTSYQPGPAPLENPFSHSYHAKKTGGAELILTVGSLHIGPFILHTSSFQPAVQSGIVYRKKPLRQRRATIINL